VRLPGALVAGVTESGLALVPGNGVAASRQDGSATVIEIGSGRYTFAYQMQR
jgi:hypothetical protein